MLRKLAEYQHNVHLRCPGAQKALEDFKVQQTEMVAAICEVGSILPWPNYAKIHYSPRGREGNGATILLRGVIWINRLLLASGSRRRLFVVQRNRH